MKVLIVDDSSFQRNVMQAVFKQHGHETVLAVNGLEGLEMAKTHAPGLIISDILMPKMDGFTFLRRLKQDAQLKDIPVIVCSVTYSGQRERELAAALGADGFIERPKSPELFWSEVEAVLMNLKTRGPAQPVPELVNGDNEFLASYVGIISAKLDKKVGELERAQEQLVSTRHRLEHLLAYSPAVIYSCEPEPGIRKV